VGISIYLIEDLQGAVHLLIFCASQEKYISLHAMDVYSRSYLNVWICSSCSFQILFTVVIADV